jgi:hypothetical protein
MRRIGTAGIIFLFSGLMPAGSALAHEQYAGANFAQTYVSHADLAVTSTPIPILPVNSVRVSALCQNTGTNSMRIGDANVSNAQGTLIAPNGSAVFDVTSALYASSQNGTTAHCDEVVRE